jgi:hypothetical protein|tara:strand:+ start:46 stop:429 length:384 start_codon:yes stop_codon:yes gene_type:complete
MKSKHERKEAGKILAPTTVSNYNLNCILDTCFEGGSNYWIDRIVVVDDDYKGADYGSEVISCGGELKVFVDEGNPHHLTKTKLLQGCQLYVTGHSRVCGREWRPDDFDAEDTDIILQYALFGEVVYA